MHQQHSKKKLITWTALSIGSSLLSLLFVLFHDSLQSLLQKQIQNQMTLQPGTQMLSHWTDPPLQPELKAYIYNVTNAKEFLAGIHEKIHVSEIGPFVYRSRVSKNVTSHAQKSLSFTSSSFYTFVPEKSIAHHDDLRVTVPNLVILSALMKKETRESMGFIKSSIIWPLLTSLPASSQEAFISLTPNEYLWGYEEDLACLGSSGEEEEEVDPFFRSESTLPERKVSRFWDEESRSCRFGIISQNNNTVSKEMTIDSGASSLYSKCRVEIEEGRFAVRKRLPQDTYDPSCPPSPSSNPLHEFGLMMDFFCGDIRMELDSGQGWKNTPLIQGQRYVPAESSFKDLIPIESCSEGVPFYISQPRFYGSDFRQEYAFIFDDDSSYQDQIEGIPQGTKDLHGLYMDLESTYGGILGLQMRFQLNLKLTKDPEFEVISHLAREETMIPLIWLQEGYENLPALQMVSLHVGLYMPAVLPKGMALFFGVLSIIFSSILLHRLRMNNEMKKNVEEFECRYAYISDAQKYI